MNQPKLPQERLDALQRETFDYFVHEVNPLAYETNHQPLTHLHGEPLRLRVENQLGFKMVKWIQARMALLSNCT
jgi:DMSO/TMAO reductase YedYZ molybdopterin-dependent catalytic subunit